MGLLRLVLAAGVVSGHISDHDLLAGGLGSVQCFYVISGFFIAMILSEKYTAAGDRMLFYSNRLLRIFSMYWIFLALAAAVAVVTRFQSHTGPLVVWSQAWSRLTPFNIAYLVFTNLFLFAQEATLFLSLGDHGMTWIANFRHGSTPWVMEFMFIGQAWTLSVELLFYFLAPFIVRRSTLTIGALIAASVAARIVAQAFGLWDDPWSYRFLPFELAFFLAGALGYRAYVMLRDQPAGIASRLFAYGVFVALLLFPFYKGALVFSPGRLFLYAYVIVSVPLLFRITRNNRWDRWLGEFSYPLYLCHYAVFNVCQLSFRLAKYPILRAWIAFAISMILSGVVVKFIDIPIDRFRQLRLRRHHADA